MNISFYFLYIFLSLPLFLFLGFFILLRKLQLYDLVKLFTLALEVIARDC